MKSIFLIIVINLICSVSIQAQYIKLTNRNTKKEVAIKKGMRVSYVLKNKGRAVTGILNEITSTSITVDATTVSLEELSGFGRRKKGSGFGSFVMAFFGGAMIGSVIFADNSDPCPQCQTVSVEDNTAGKILTIAGGVTLIGLAFNTGIKNSPRNLEVWDLEVIIQP
jgi:hypothetical protein